MQTPLQIRFHGTDPSAAVEAKVREHAEKLGQYYDPIIGCRVAIEALHHHHRQGNLYSVKLWITVPDGEIAVTHDPGLDHRHEDPYIAIHDAFRAARRRLEDYARSHRGDVKSHAVPAHGRVGTIDLDSGWGEIVSSDGREIAFHRNSVVEADFARLTPGMEVRFSEVPGEDGPVASTVHVIGKHHIAG
jgi:cold shock CspA family protein